MINRILYAIADIHLGWWYCKQSHETYSLIMSLESDDGPYFWYFWGMLGRTHRDYKLIGPYKHPVR